MTAIGLGLIVAALGGCGGDDGSAEPVTTTIQVAPTGGETSTVAGAPPEAQPDGEREPTKPSSGGDHERNTTGEPVAPAGDDANSSSDSDRNRSSRGPRSHSDSDPDSDRAKERKGHGASSGADHDLSDTEKGDADASSNPPEELTDAEKDD
jgi:hypothetical protein